VVRHFYLQNIKQERLICNVQMHVQQSKSILSARIIVRFVIQSAGIDLSAESELPFSCCHTALLLLAENQYRCAFLSRQ
jgi:ribose/xylose/arabinose/galactoside ABC-type transport system permease subunit